MMQETLIEPDIFIKMYPPCKAIGLETKGIYDLHCYGIYKALDWF